MATFDYSQPALELRPGDHCCALYETPEQKRALLGEFLRQELERHQRVVYVTGANASTEILNFLTAEGVDPERHLARGELTLVNAEDAYMRNGVFDPGRFIEFLRSTEEKALADGYDAVRFASSPCRFAAKKLLFRKKLI